MRIALATYQPGPLPPSDELLRQAIERRGAQAEAAVWSDPQVRWDRYDAVVVRSCWDYHLRLPEWLDWVDRLDPLLINPAALLRWNADKRYLRGLDVELPESIFLDDEASLLDIEETCRQRGWKAAVTKPFVSASAWQTVLRSDGRVRGPLLVQEFVPEIAHGEWSLLYFGGVFSHAVRKTPARGDFRVQMEFGGLVEAASPPRAVLELGGRTLSLLPEPAVIARIDVVERANGEPLLMEAEVIEPELFLDVSGAAAALAASAVLRSVMTLEAVR